MAVYPKECCTEIDIIKYNNYLIMSYNEYLIKGILE